MPILLDAVDNVMIPDNQEGSYANEVNRLCRLGEGLCYLNRQIAKIEESLAPAEGTQMTWMGSIPGVPAGLVECSFHWYATTVCNYCRLVGQIAHEIGGTDVKSGHEYAKRVCKQAHTYRNKVAAHFARYTPHRDDTAPDVSYSVMNFPTLVNGIFRVGGVRLSMIRAGATSSTSHDTAWSLTELHAELERRYGPTFSPRSNRGA